MTASLALNVTPGPDMLYVIARGRASVGAVQPGSTAAGLRMLTGAVIVALGVRLGLLSSR